MSVSIGYRKDRLVISGIHCDCPCTHHQPTQDIYVGPGLIKHLPDYIARRDLGVRAVLVCEENTYQAAGKAALEALTGGGYKITLCLLKRDGQVEPDESAVGEVAMTMAMDTDFFISVGSGSITDITRTVAAQTERPFVCVGTAPSMDGYTSVVAPMLLRGVKIHVPAICPEIIVCDLDVMRTAPLDMFISGVGDVLGKYIARADWAIGHIVNGEDYCPACAEIVINAVDKLLENIGEIKSRSEKGARVLIEALLLSGMTIMVIGNTRAVASIEHNIVHYWEMQKLLAHEKTAPHGTAVCVSTLLVWPYFENFKNIDVRSLDEEQALNRAMDRKARESFMRTCYGGTAAEAIMLENPDDFLTRKEHARRFEAIVANFDRICAELGKLPSRQVIEQAMSALGAPMTPAEIGISGELTMRALTCAKDYRARYSLFKSIDELGLKIDSPNFEIQR